MTECETRQKLLKVNNNHNSNVNHRDTERYIYNSKCDHHKDLENGINEAGHLYHSHFVYSYSMKIN